jgi:MoxR-like ATPase
MPVPEGVVSAILKAVRSLRPGGDRPDLVWGPGPRGGQALLTAARARAFLDGRTVPILDDVAALLEPALKHRIELSYAARSAGRDVADIIRAAESGLE